MSNFFKYYKEKKDADGDQIWWPGGPDGFPFRGAQPPQTKDIEYENLSLTGKFRCKTFYLSDQKDIDEYVSIRDKCANGLWLTIDRDRQWDEETKNYKIYLEWVERAYDSPTQSGATDAVREYTKNATTVQPIQPLRTRKAW